MRRVSPHLRDAVRRRHDLVTLAELAADGFTVDDVGHHLRRGNLERFGSRTPDVFAVGPGRSFERRCAARCLGDRGAVIVGHAAAALWGFPHCLPTSTPAIDSASAVQFSPFLSLPGSREPA